MTNREGRLPWHLDRGIAVRSSSEATQVSAQPLFISLSLHSAMLAHSCLSVIYCANI